MVFFLSSFDTKGLAERLMAAGVSPEMPCAIVYKATWDDEKKFICALKDLHETAEKNNIHKTALIIVGEAVAQAGYERSRLYAPEFSTEFRTGTGDNAKEK